VGLEYLSGGVPAEMTDQNVGGEAVRQREQGPGLGAGVRSTQGGDQPFEHGLKGCVVVPQRLCERGADCRTSDEREPYPGVGTVRVVEQGDLADCVRQVVGLE
jgi:hypothetical protein